MREGPVPASYTFDAGAGVILVTATGEFTAADYSAVQHAVEADAAIPTRSGVLFDMRGVTKFAITRQDVIGFAHDADSVDRRASRIAVVVDSPEGYSLARMYEAARATKRPPLKVFGAIEPAMGWLVSH